MSRTKRATALLLGNEYKAETSPACPALDGPAKDVHEMFTWLTKLDHHDGTNRGQLAVRKAPDLGAADMVQKIIDFGRSVVSMQDTIVGDGGLFVRIHSLSREPATGTFTSARLRDMPNVTDLSCNAPTMQHGVTSASLIDLAAWAVGRWSS